MLNVTGPLRNAGKLILLGAAIAMASTSVFAAESKNGKPIPPLPEISKKTKNGKPIPPLPATSKKIGPAMTTVPSAVTASGLLRRQPTATARRVPGAGQPACAHGTRRNIAFRIKSDGKKVNGGKVSIKKINPDLSLQVIVRNAATYGGGYTARGLCPGNYVADIFGTGPGGLIKDKSLFYHTGQQRFTFSGNSTFTINLEKVITTVTVTRVNNGYPRHRITNIRGYRMPTPASGVKEFIVNNRDGKITAQVHCCQRYTFDDTGSSTHVTPQNLWYTPRAGGTDEARWNYIPAFRMPNIVGLRLNPPFRGIPNGEFRPEWGVDFMYNTNTTRRRHEDNTIHAQSVPHRRLVQYGEPVIITVNKYR